MESSENLLKGQWTPLEKMKKEQLAEECKAWRSLFSWLDEDVKTYLSRTGTMVGVQDGKFQRHIGPLLATKWVLKYVEIGVFEKVYDQTKGCYFYEKKIIRIPAGRINNFEWIAERITEDELETMETVDKEPDTQN